MHYCYLWMLFKERLYLINRPNVLQVICSAATFSYTVFISLNDGLLKLAFLQK